MLRAFKVIFYILVIAAISYLLIFEQEYLKLPNFLGIHKIDETIQSDTIVSKEATKAQASVAGNSEDNRNNTDVIINCKLALVSIDNILIKFFQKQDFSNEVFLLKSSNLPIDIVSQLDFIRESYNYKEHNIIQNKVIAKMIRINKISEDANRKKDFVEAMQKLQEYFYSKKFLSSCKL